MTDATPSVMKYTEILTEKTPSRISVEVKIGRHRYAVYFQPVGEDPMDGVQFTAVEPEHEPDFGQVIDAQSLDAIDEAIKAAVEAVEERNMSVVEVQDGE